MLQTGPRRTAMRRATRWILLLNIVYIDAFRTGTRRATRWFPLLLNIVYIGGTRRHCEHSAHNRGARPRSLQPQPSFSGFTFYSDSDAPTRASSPKAVRACFSCAVRSDAPHSRGLPGAICRFPKQQGEELVGDAPPGPPPNCGRKCSSDSDCQTGGFVQYPTCYVNSGTMCHGYCGP